jgi:hypothetical protein
MLEKADTYFSDEYVSTRKKKEKEKKEIYKERKERETRQWIRPICILHFLGTCAYLATTFYAKITPLLMVIYFVFFRCQFAKTVTNFVSQL